LHASAEAPANLERALHLLPTNVNGFKSAIQPKPLNADIFAQPFPNLDAGSLSGYERVYDSRDNGIFTVVLINTSSEDSAYGQLKKLVAEARGANRQVARIPGIGTLAYRIDDEIAFFKGPAIEIIKSGNKPVNSDAVVGLAQGLADALPSVDNDVPPLVKHLPKWDQVEDQSRFAVSLSGLKEIVANQPILDSVDFSGGAEAIVAPYDNIQLAVVEFTTPQLATTNDNRIKTRLEELKAGNQPLPTTYRRVGNYSVFVFNAPDLKTAENLVNGIAYEQVVQWLGNNPNILRRAQHLYAATTANIVLSVIKASGLSLVLCLGIGGLFGAFVFKKRRARLVRSESYSDAGGMIRLGIDELNVQTNPVKLIGPPES
jgi:hypothetical protein